MSNHASIVRMKDGRHVKVYVENTPEGQAFRVLETGGEVICTGLISTDIEVVGGPWTVSVSGSWTPPRDLGAPDVGEAFMNLIQALQE